MKNWLLAIAFILQATWSNASTLTALSVNTPDEAQPNTQYLSEFYGNVPMNFMEARAWSITNNGQSSIYFDRIIIRGVMFSARTNCPAMLMPQQRCTVEADFQPFAQGYFTGELDITFIQGGNIFIDLSGYGVR